MNLLPGMFTCAALAFGTATAVAQRLPAEVDSASQVVAVPGSAMVDASVPNSAVSADVTNNLMGGEIARHHQGKFSSANISGVAEGLSPAQKQKLAALAAQQKISPNSATMAVGTKTKSSIGLSNKISSKQTVSGAKRAPGLPPTDRLSGGEATVGSPFNSELGSALQPGIKNEGGSGIRPQLGSALNTTPFGRSSRSFSATRSEPAESGATHSTSEAGRRKAARDDSPRVHAHESLQSSRPKSLNQRREEERQAACPSCAR
jgi:hypothetical protein